MLARRTLDGQLAKVGGQQVHEESQRVLELLEDSNPRVAVLQRVHGAAQRRLDRGARLRATRFGARSVVPTKPARQEAGARGGRRRGGVGVEVVDGVARPTQLCRGGDSVGARGDGVGAGGDGDGAGGDGDGATRPGAKRLLRGARALPPKVKGRQLHLHWMAKQIDVCDEGREARVEGEVS